MSNPTTIQVFGYQLHITRYDRKARPEPHLVRQWAQAQGIQVGARGRIPAEVWDTYLAAHK